MDNPNPFSIVIKLLNKKIKGDVIVNKGSSIMTVIYELLDELIGGILPGIYFCTYFLICALIIIGSESLDSLCKSPYIIGIPFLAISYVLGTLFRRGSTEFTDVKSVKYILKKSKNDIKNSEYMLDISSNYLRGELFEEIKNLKKLYLIPISLSYIENQKRIWQTVKCPNHKVFIYIMKRVYRIYQFVNLRCVLLNPLFLLFGKQSKFLSRMIKKKNDLKNLYEKMYSDFGFKVDYPYTHLKKYLEENGMSNLAQYVTWNSSDGRKTKVFINEIIDLLTENHYLGMKQVKKREAHIRFMNSAFHSQRILFFCASAVFAGVLFLFFIRFIWLWHLNFPKVSFTIEDDGTIVFFFYKVFDYINRIVAYEDMFTIMCISAVYMVFYAITRRLVLGNYHYQRLHEIVYLLQAKNHVISRKKNN